MSIKREIEEKINKYISDLNITYEILKNVDTRISELNKELATKEAEQDDLLHEVELANLNVVERSKFYNNLKKVREDRRLIKDELQICRTIKPLADIMIKKGVYAELGQGIKNLESCKNLMNERIYHAKVRKDLKCVEKVEVQKWKIKQRFGEYVRTKDGRIGTFNRYSSRPENSIYKSPFNCFVKMQGRKTPLQCCRDYILKHSKNIIDLIEAGDIVLYKIKGLEYFNIAVVEEYTEARTLKKELRVGLYSFSTRTIRKGEVRCVNL